MTCPLRSGRQPKATIRLPSRAKAYAEQIANLADQTDRYRELLDDSAWQRWQQQLDVQTRRAERVTLAVRNQRLAMAVATGEVGRHAAGVAALSREYDSLQKQAKLQELVAVHGVWGGVMRNNADGLGRLKTVATVAYAGFVGLTAGLIRSGLQGTVEGYRLEMAWTRLGRQVAAIAIPAIDTLAKTIGSVAGWLEKPQPGAAAWTSFSNSEWLRLLPHHCSGFSAACSPLLKGSAVVVKELAVATGIAAAIAPAAAGGAGCCGSAAGGAGRAVAGAAGAGFLSRRLGGLSRVALPAAIAVGGLAALEETSCERAHNDEGVGEYYRRKRE